MLELMGAVMVFTIIGALVAIESRELLSAVVSVTAVGFGWIVAFFYLRAPDVAIVPIVVEVLVLVILIRATLRAGLKGFIGNRGLFGMIATITLLAFFFLIGIRVFDSLPEFGEPVFASIPGTPAMEYVKSGLNDTGSSNIVTAVVLDYRAYDALAQLAVLFAAIIGAISVLRKKARKEAAEREVDEWPR